MTNFREDLTNVVSAALPSDSEGGNKAVCFTFFTSKTALSKTFTLNLAGQIEKTATAQMYEGIAVRQKIHFSEFVKALEAAKEKNAFAYGVHDASYPDKVHIRVGGKADPDKSILARTQDYYQFEGAGIFMIDHDPSEFGFPHDTESLLALLAVIMPEFAQSARIERGSLSAGVHFPDEQPQAGKGFRLYFPVANARDIPRFSDNLLKRLWLHGAGFIALSKSGAKLTRTVLDGSVYTPERLDFTGSPIVGTGLAYTPSQPIFHDGQTLDTSLLSDLTQDELTRYEQLIADAKKAIEPESQTAQNKFVADKIADMVMGGVVIEVAHKTISAITETGFKQLYGDYILDFKASGKITVAELLKQGERFDKQPLADPIEGRDYGSTTAKFFWNKGNKPLINSFAHGAETKYFLFAEKPMEHGEDYPKIEDRPCYKVFDDWWYKEKGGKAQKPGVWFFTASAGTEQEPPRLIDSWLCSPLYVLSNARSKHDVMWGSVLKFQNKDKKWHYWNMPSKMLAGTTVEIIGELADRGIDFDRKMRNQIAEYINVQHPTERILTAPDIGWFTTVNGKRFVLPTQTLGGNDDVIYRGDFSQQDNHFLPQGTLEDWRSSVSALAINNHYLTLCIAVGFTGALLEMLAVDGVGIHAYNDSSCGKSTGQAAASSIWGNPKDCVKSWKTTANGLEGAAALFNDGLLALDEMGDAEPKEVSDALYMLVNGRGKNRANVNGLSRKSNVWRVATLSNGEHPIETFLAKRGITAQAGQLARFLQFPVKSKFGVHDDLHNCKGGAAFSDLIKTNTAKQYGTAGVAFIQNLITHDEQDIRSLFDDLQKSIVEDHGQLEGQEHRAAKAFSVIALAGELATSYGITGWKKGSALNTTKNFFKLWRDTRGHGDLESTRILDTIKSYAERFGDARFTCILDDTRLHGERSGYWRDTDKGRQWLFTKSGLQQATQGYDIKQVIAVLKISGWLELDGQRKTAKTAVFKNNESKSDRFYHVNIPDFESHLENIGVSGVSGVSSLNLNVNNANTFENLGVSGVSVYENTTANTLDANTANTFKNKGVSEITYINQKPSTANTANTDKTPNTKKF